MKRILYLLCLLLFCPSVAVFAGNVEQRGYVRTIGRPNNKSGTRLPNAIIRVQGMHNAVKSNQNGDFSILFNNAKVGVDGYYLSSVRLVGYEVNEKEVLGRKFAVSATVPHEIVMISVKEKYEIEDRVRRQVEKRYVEKIRQLEAEKDKLGEEHYFTSTCYHNLGFSLWKLEELEEAKACFDKGLEICLKVLGENHPSVAISYNILGYYYFRMGDLDKAEAYCRKSFDINSRVYCIGNNALINNYNNLGTVYGSRGDYAKAMEFLQKSLDMALDVFGECHLTTLTAYANMADYSMLAGDYVKSEECLEHELSLTTYFHGLISSQTIDVYCDYGRLYEKQNKLDEAIGYYSTALGLMEDLNSSDYLVKGRIHESIADCYSLQKDGKMEYLYTYRALDAYKSVLEKSDVKLAELMVRMASLSMKVRNDFYTAYSFAKSAYEIYSANYGEENPRAVEVKELMDMIGECIEK